MLQKRNAGQDARAIIVGSGPSALGFRPPDDVAIFAVNGAIEWLPRADYFFTLDPSADNLRRLDNPVAGVRYFAAVPGQVLLPGHVTRLIRVSARGPEPPAHGSPQWWLWRWSAVPGLSDKPGHIHSGNSAYGALGLAYQMGFTRVALLGVDGTTEPRIEGGRPGCLAHLPLLFASARSQIDVISCGALTGIPVMSIGEWLCGS